MDLKERCGNSCRHPWELARSRIVQRVLDDELSGRSSLRLLDIGCGDGFLLTAIAKNENIASADGLDINLRQEELLPLCDGKVCLFNDPQEVTGHYDVIFLMDVLEHVEDDGDFLTRIVKDHANSRTIFIISVPGFPGLFSSHDIFLNHYRRYSFSMLESIVQKAGLAILREGGVCFLLLLPRALSCLKEKIFKNRRMDRAGIGRWKAGPFLTRIIASVLYWENYGLWRAARWGIRIPGLTLWMVARKPL